MNRVISFALPVEADAAEAPPPCPPTWRAAIAAERSPPAAAPAAAAPARRDALLAGLTSLLVNLPPQQTL